MTHEWYTPPSGTPWLDAVPVKVADAEQARETGGCLMLYPTQNDVLNLAVPGGERPEDMHVTIIYFGEDVSDLGGAEIPQAVQGIADQFPPITAEAFGHAIFNPQGESPCAVYLIGNSQELADLHCQLYDVISPLWDLSGQHVPWTPHITAGYGLDPGTLGYTGPVVFDRLGLSWQGQIQWFPLT